MLSYLCFFFKSESSLRGLDPAILELELFDGDLLSRILSDMAVLLASKGM